MQDLEPVWAKYKIVYPDGLIVYGGPQGTLTNFPRAEVEPWTAEGEEEDWLKLSVDVHGGTLYQIELIKENE